MIGRERIGAMVDFSELLKKRRAIRDFEEKAVPVGLVKEIIKESCLAPSSGNGQPWRFIVVNNREVMKRLSDESKANLLSYIEKNPNTPFKKYEADLRDEGFNVFYNAPCLVYVIGPKEIPSLQVDCALLACYFMFAAAARNLGTCWVDLGSAIRSTQILEEIGMPKDHRIVAPIIVGYPRAIPDPSDRNDPQILSVIS